MIKLKLARAIKEVFYLEWLANTVVIKKKNGMASMCKLYESKQNLSQRSLLDTSDKPIGEYNS